MKKQAGAFIFFCFIAVVPASIHSASPVRLNELASEETSPQNDWVELYVAVSSANLSGWALFEQGSQVKTFPSPVICSLDTYIVIHFNSSLPDETSLTGDLNRNGALDLYTPDAGLTGTSNVVTFRNARGRIIDAVVYSDNSSWTSAQQAAFNLAVSTGQWTGTINGGAAQNFTESVNIPKGIGSGNSIGRDPLSNDSDDEAEANQDWTFLRKNQTMGRQNAGLANGIMTLPEGKMFEILQSPFSPHGQGRFSEALIGYPSSPGGRITIQIYDVYGNLVRTLLRSSESGHLSGEIRWDGRDNDGRVVPIGIYVVHLEVLSADGGLSKDDKTVVVGRKL